MKDDPEGVSDEAALLEAFSEIPTISGAWVHSAAPGLSTLTVQSTQRNIAANAQRQYLTVFSLSEDYAAAAPLQPSFPMELKDVSMLSVSPSGKRTFIVRAGAEGKSATLEVWGGGRLLKELQVPKALHGSIYNDGWFGAGAAWSPDESRLAYVAEAPQTRQTPPWGNTQANAPSTGADATGAEGGGDGGGKPAAEEAAAPKTWRGVGEFQEDWGELNSGKAPPALFVLDTGSWRVAPVAGLAPDASAGQPVWTPDGGGLVFVAWPHAAPNFPTLPQRLGIVYCFNRPCALWAAEAPDTSAPAAGTATAPAEANAGGGPTQAADTAQPDGAAAGGDGDGASATSDQQQAVKLTPDLQSAFSPRFQLGGPDGGGRLVFLSQQAACESGVHNGTTSVHSLPWQEGSASLDAAKQAAAAGVADVLPVVHSSSADSFPGLYTVSLPAQPFEGQRLVATTQWRSTAAIVSISLDGGGGGTARLSPTDGAAWTLLDINNGWAVAACSCPASPSWVYVARLPDSHGGSSGSSGNEPHLQWHPIKAAGGVAFDQRVAAALEDTAHDVLKLRLLQEDGATEVAFEAVVVRRRSTATPAPTVLFLHGGPHAAYVASYVASIAYLAALGYVVVVPNYRGSTGYGEQGIQSLPGRAGTADVADCMTSLQAAIDKGWADPKRVAAVGGSHGGFLVGHLVGQHPTAFAAGVLRNPVLDLSAMIHLSDIPDWCYIEAYGTQEGKERMAARPTAADLEVFWAASPIAHVQRVAAPLLFLLGAKDRREALHCRVPLTDAQLYVRALRARGADAPETRTIVFPEDTHALDRPQTEFEQWVQVAAWLKRHMPS